MKNKKPEVGVITNNDGNEFTSIIEAAKCECSPSNKIEDSDFIILDLAHLEETFWAENADGIEKRKEILIEAIEHCNTKYFCKPTIFYLMEIMHLTKIN